MPQTICIKRKEWDSLKTAHCQVHFWETSYGTLLASRELVMMERDSLAGRIALAENERDDFDRMLTAVEKERDSHKQLLLAVGAECEKWRDLDRNRRFSNRLLEKEVLAMGETIWFKSDPIPGYRSALTRARNVPDLIIGTVVGVVAGAGLVFLFMRHFS